MQRIIISCMCVIMMIFSGCGPSADADTSRDREETVLWKTNGFAVSEQIENAKSLWLGEINLLEHGQLTEAAKGMTWEWLYSGVSGEIIWHLGVELGDDKFLVGDAQRQYVLEIYRPGSGEIITKMFRPGEFGSDLKMGFISSLDTPDGEHFAIWWNEYQRDEEDMYSQTADYLIFTDFKENTRITDYWQAFLEKGIKREAISAEPLNQSVDWGCDGQGNIYVMDGNRGAFFYDQKGELFMEYEAEEGRQVAKPLRTEEGELIFPVYHNHEKSYDFLWADMENWTFQSLAKMKASQPFMNTIYGMQGNDIYYCSSDPSDSGIVKWNVKNGKQEKIVSLRTCGIYAGYETQLVFRKEGNPYLILKTNKADEKKQWIAQLSGEKRKREGEICIVDFTGDGERFRYCATLASTETPKISFVFEDGSSQESRTRWMADLTRGEGPDLMIVSEEDLQMLGEKGVLLDLGKCLSEAQKEKILPGVLEIGSVEGKLFGLPAAIRADTMVVAKSTWNQDSWKLEDVIELMEEGKLMGAVRSSFPGRNYFAPLETMTYLLRGYENQSFLLDREKGRSHFDDERFVRLLELTCSDFSRESTDQKEWLNGGKDVLAQTFYSYAEFIDFFVHMETEEGVVVGYPTTGTCGSYLKAQGGILVINKNFTNEEAIKLFLNMFLGEEMSSQGIDLGMSIKKLVPEKYLVENADGGLNYMSADDRAPKVPVFVDGTTPLHRGKVFLESCVPAPSNSDVVGRILVEELRTMYAEGRTAINTANVIDNRMQLYLNEL